MWKPNKTLYLRSTFPVKCWSEIVFKVIKPTIDKRPWDNDPNGRNYYMYTEINSLKTMS